MGSDRVSVSPNSNHIFEEVEAETLLLFPLAPMGLIRSLTHRIRSSMIDVHARHSSINATNSEDAILS
jgi:hypothetical protein